MSHLRITSLVLSLSYQNFPQIPTHSQAAIVIVVTELRLDFQGSVPTISLGIEKLVLELLYLTELEGQNKLSQQQVAMMVEMEVGFI